MCSSASFGFSQNSAGLNGLDGRILALGDFNGDLQMDVVFGSSDQKSLSLLLWEQHSQSYRTAVRKTIVEMLPSQSSDGVMVNVIPADFNHDGLLDLVVIFKVFNLNHNLLAFLAGQGDNFVISAKPAIPMKLPQPFLADIYGNLQATLLGYNDSNPDTLASFSFSEDPSSPLDFVSAEFSEQDCEMPSPHSSAFIDIDGDCLADIFLVCRKKGSSLLEFHILITKIDGGYTHHEGGILPLGAGQITFADMNSDGTMDFVLPVCPSPNNCQIQISYNRQIPVCTSGMTTSCRDPHNLCIADPFFSFDHGSASLARLIPGQTLLLTDETFIGLLPIPIRVGDYNNDGFPDLLLITQSISDNSKTFVQILESVDHHNPNPTFSLVSNGMNAIHEFRHPVGATFLDFNNDGALDLFVFYKEANKIETASFLNQFFFDAFFFKPLVLNDLCLGACPESNVSLPYGVSYSGATIKYAIVDTKGALRVTQVSQYPQQQYLALISPQPVIGLGRTNNYIEDLFVGVSRRKDAHFAAYQGIIPNSKVVIGPYEASMNDGPSSWRIELYMNPSSTSFAIIVVLCSTLVGLALVVGFFDLVERAEDELDRKSRIHSINFDAL